MVPLKFAKPTLEVSLRIVKQSFRVDSAVSQEQIRAQFCHQFFFGIRIAAEIRVELHAASFAHCVSEFVKECFVIVRRGVILRGVGHFYFVTRRDIACAVCAVSNRDTRGEREFFGEGNRREVFIRHFAPFDVAAFNVFKIENGIVHHIKKRLLTGLFGRLSIEANGNALGAFLDHAASGLGLVECHVFRIRAKVRREKNIDAAILTLAYGIAETHASELFLPRQDFGGLDGSDELFGDNLCNFHGLIKHYIRHRHKRIIVIFDNSRKSLVIKGLRKSAGHFCKCLIFRELQRNILPSFSPVFSKSDATKPASPFIEHLISSS